MALQPSTHAASPDRRRLLVALGIATATALVELIGALLTGSVALLADSLHVAADMGALALALLAVWMAARPHTLRWTFGLHRAEVLAATLNGLALLLLSGGIAWEAARRLRSPTEVDAAGLLLVALAGLAANAVQLYVLRSSHSVNMRAARLHVLSDLAGSLAAVTAGIAVGVSGEARLDSLLSFVIVGLIVVGALRLLRETTDILMVKTPEGIALADVDRGLRAIPGVRAVHDMHAWTITSGFVAFVCHLEVDHGSDATAVVAAAVRLLREDFGVDHVTVQPEAPPLHDLAAPLPRG